MIESSKKGELSSAELILLNKLDLAQLHQFELAAKLSVSLIGDWLTKYKFKNWEKSESHKQERAKEIAEKLNDHQRWYTHGSSIHKDILERDLRLRINDYGEDTRLKQLVWSYFWSLAEYAGAGGFIIHSRIFI